MRKTFEIKSGKIVISDPCYDFSEKNVITNVRNGLWEADVELDRNRISELYLINRDGALKYINNELDYAPKLPMLFGVDSGQLGFFDYDFYRNDNYITEVPTFDCPIEKSGDKWYNACCDITLGEEQWGTLLMGVVSSSGWGDGTYEVRALKDVDGQYIGFKAIFIDVNDDFDDEDFDEDEEEDDDF